MQGILAVVSSESRVGWKQSVKLLQGDSGKEKSGSALGGGSGFGRRRSNLSFSLVSVDDYVEMLQSANKFPYSKQMAPSCTFRCIIPIHIQDVAVSVR